MKFSSLPDAPRNPRRRFLKNAGLAALAAPFAALAGPDTGEGVTFADGPRPLVRYPGKRALIRVHTRPPHLETPFHVFNEGVLTPNDAFFVRYHLANIPLSVDPVTFRLSVRGAVGTPLSLSLGELRAMGEPVETVAVNQCSGNSRGFSSPRVFGAQLANGAMGNARWTGLPLRLLLQKAGVQAAAKQVVFNGLDTPLLPVTPDFRKALDIEHAMSEEPLVAWAMNGQALPMLNGYPLKLVVPGYFGTYWVKHLSEIEVIDHTFEGHDALFMTTAYRVPDNDCQCVEPGTTPARTRPISTLPVRSFITSVMNGAVILRGRSIELKGIAFDAGAGIKRVEVSVDGGLQWREAVLGKDIGQYSFPGMAPAQRLRSAGPGRAHGSRNQSEGRDAAGHRRLESGRLSSPRDRIDVGYHRLKRNLS